MISVPSWIRRLFRPQRPARRKQQAQPRLKVERLEDRLMPSASDPFSFLQSGFSQQVVGYASGFFGGVTFDNSDSQHPAALVVNENSGFNRFDLSAAFPINGDPNFVSASVGIGITNHPDGTFYSNTFNGITNFDANGNDLRAAFGNPGSGTGITVDPQSADHNLVYADASGTISFVDPVTQAGGIFSGVASPVTNGSYDQIAFDPTGNFLLLSDAGSETDGYLDIMDRGGNVLQHIHDVTPGNANHAPDGIAFVTAGSSMFVITNNRDGTITRYDFGNGFGQAPTSISLFASGGFRGDMAAIGPDGALYVTQNGRHDTNGGNTGQQSLVRIAFTGTPTQQPPVITPPADQTATVGISQAFNLGSFSDPDGGNWHVDVNWGDNHTDSTASFDVSAPGSLGSLSHVYTDQASYTVTVTVTDAADNQSDTKTFHITAQAPTSPMVVLQADPCDPSKTALVVVGTNLDDNIEVKVGSASHPGRYEVEVHNSSGTFRQSGDSATPISRVIVYGLDGNDVIDADTANRNVPAWLFGGKGDDVLYGSRDGDVLVGGDGNDTLYGGRGRDLLIGGAGADRLVAGAGQDILVAGSTNFDGDLHALCRIMDEWTRTTANASLANPGADFTSRRLNLMNGGGLNGMVVRLNTSTVQSDNSVDRLRGGAGADWFLANFAGTGPFDQLVDFNAAVDFRTDI